MFTYALSADTGSHPTRLQTRIAQRQSLGSQSIVITVEGRCASSALMPVPFAMIAFVSIQASGSSRIERIRVVP